MEPNMDALGVERRRGKNPLVPITIHLFGAGGINGSWPENIPSNLTHSIASCRWLTRYTMESRSQWYLVKFDQTESYKFLLLPARDMSKKGVVSSPLPISFHGLD
jgi:hypothetical protein